MFCARNPTAVLTLLMTLSLATSAIADWSDMLGINRPWDDLPDVRDTVKRHRDSLAYVVSKLSVPDVPKESLDHLYADLARTSPEPPIEELQDSRSYRVHIPMDFYIKLGQRKKNLGDPRPGSIITSEDVMAEIFP